MISHGEIPGGCNRLQPLLYPFHRLYPLKILSNIDGFEILEFNLFYLPLIKEKNGLL